MSLNLNIALGGVDTSMPRLVSGNYEVVIDDFEVVDSKKDASKKNLLVKFKTTSDGESTQGGVVRAGYQLRKYYPLQQSENENAPDFRRDLAVLIDAGYGTDETNRPDLSEDTIIGLRGKRVLMSVKVSKDDAYGETNEVGMLKHIA